LYEVDLRLRPSGRQGPVATAIGAFRRYQMDEAWTWEHMALTRARVLTGTPALASEIEAVRCAVITDKAAPDLVARDAGDMRARMAAAGRKGGTWAVKDGPGGMQDIELLAQAAALMAGAPVRAAADQLDAGADLGWIPPGDAETLAQAHQLYSRVIQAGRLLSEDTLDPGAIGAGGRAFLARQAGAADADTLASQLDQTRADALRIIDAILGPFQAKDSLA
jgi:glutamate-ammonia-ligase adenylyltransferase